MAWTYVGKGAFIPGVPARDLSDNEVKELDVKADVEASDLYKRESASKKKSADEGKA